ncbi:MAG: hypothetical protein RLZZ210_473 [Pseudomonadota bacterium]|jgi:hypothetical protein
MNVCHNLNFQTQEIRKFSETDQTENNHFERQLNFFFCELGHWVITSHFEEIELYVRCIDKCQCEKYQT